MAIEEEFSIEIPDAEADEITTVQQGTCRPYIVGSYANEQLSTTLPRYATLS
jgi:hypothetical protein